MKRGRLAPIRRVSGTVEELSDAALVAACALGESAALGALIDRFQRPLHRFVARLLGSDGEDRADLVQATFVQVAQSAKSYRQASSVRVWIFGIAANLTRNHIRALVRTRRMQAALISLPAVRPARPDDEAQRREMMTRLRSALAELPHDLREAFVLCDLEELSAREAAAAIGVREGTIWRRVHEARKALRTAIEGGTA
jgi:RNA polymerase sigma-70 factor (ECF subfamily)